LSICFSFSSYCSRTATEGTSALIQIEDVTKRFPGGQEALRGLTMSVGRGEMVFITGHSGAGKSTL
ncbi:MAG: ATP-binding cassette domain-containing protein, partial [Woeseiaceae bacterium]|nr:ATP-binding cassette domain-containing protein [Woeseiaceae bacterium]